MTTSSITDRDRVRAKKRHLGCCCCGGDGGYFEQHWNRDTGYGICARCVAWQRSRGTTEAEIADLYGREGVNFPAVAEPEPTQDSGS